VYKNSITGESLYIKGIFICTVDTTHLILIFNKIDNWFLLK